MQRWVRAFADPNFTVKVNTNNGVEVQNRVLKHTYLQPYRKSSLSTLMTIIVEKFIPDTYKRYVIV